MLWKKGFRITPENIYPTKEAEMKTINLDNEVKISETDINFFDENGFLFIKSVLSKDEAEFYREIIDEVVKERTRGDNRPLSERTPYEREFLQCGHLWWEYPEIKGLTLSRRLGSIAKQLLKASKIRLWHDQALYKLPGGDATLPHQDVSYWPMKERLAGTLWIALDNVTEEMGAMSFVPGTHKAGIDGYNHRIEDAINNESKILELSTKIVKKETVSFNLEPGDATFHHGLTVHFTKANNTEKIRKGMTIIYFNDGVRYDSLSPAKDHLCAAGSKENQPIATERTPIII
jgi:ectoine hydroxylase-related dioxygenase (phytanoyl-CoA dioxygenase family)